MFSSRKESLLVDFFFLPFDVPGQLKGIEAEMQLLQFSLFLSADFLGLEHSFVGCASFAIKPDDSLFLAPFAAQLMSGQEVIM